MDVKHEDNTNEKAASSATRATTTKDARGPSAKSNHLPWLAAATVLAAVSYVFMSRNPTDVGTTTSSTRLPESYAICAEEGKIYTVDDSKPNVDCMVIVRGDVASYGTIDEIQQYWDDYQNELIKKFYGNEPKAKKPLHVYQSKPGSIIVPGLTDAHAHLVEYGLKVQLPLDGTQTIDDVLDILENYVRSHPEMANDASLWIEGWGWDQSRWKNWSGELPTAAHLASRELLADRLMSLRRADGHAVWVSYAAMEQTLASLPDQHWPDTVEGGDIIRDADGEPTGVFLDNAILLIQSPPWTPNQMEEYLQRAFSDALAVGLTTVHDAFVPLEYLEVFQKMADEGQIPIRVYAMGGSENTSYWGNTIPRLEDYGQDGRLNLRSVKLFTDGALGSWGAALLEPYSDKPDTAGIMRSSPEALEAMVRKFWKDDWSTNIHCIGDRANKVVLDIYDRLLHEESKASGESVLTIAERRRPRIEHAQIMQLEDLNRAGELGVITSVQPTHATSDMWYAEKRLGPERIKGAYAYQTLLQASPLKILPLGSDFPVEGINPLLGYYAAVSRLDVHGESPHGSAGWYPTEKLTRKQALKGATLDAAYASFTEDILGSLTPGKRADYVVLDRDIVDDATPVAEILETTVLATVVDGQIAYGEI